jgi:hypothetical protein
MRKLDAVGAVTMALIVIWLLGVGLKEALDFLDGMIK